MPIPILRVRNENGDMVSIPAIKGEKGDANVTVENIESALGYTPANEERVTQLKQDVVILQELGLQIVEALTQNEMTQRG